MKTRATALLSLSLLIVTASSVFAETKGEEHKKDKFFAPGPVFWEPQSGIPSEFDDRPFSSPPLFKQIGTDFRNVFSSKENLMVLGTGLGAALAASSLDERIPASRFNSELYEGTKLDRTFESGELLGSTLVQVGGAFVTFGIGKLTSNPEVEDLGRDLVRAQILSQAMTQMLKFSVARARPDESNNHSFPSGHSSGAFATATVLQRRYGWKVGLPAYGVAGFIAASRLSENKHFLSDVIFGAAVGIVAGRTVTFGSGNRRFELSPMLTPGGVGVQFTLLPRQ